MPYIHPDLRWHLDRHIRDLPDELETPGDLAYVITQLMLAYWRRNPSYATWAAMRGAVEDQVDEFRRRVVGPYEDQKIKENSDVF